MEEIWRDIEGYEGIWKVSNFGNVRKLIFHGRYYEHDIKPTLHHTGYLVVQLSKKPYKTSVVHRLVAKAFIPPVKGKTCVNHIDGNKTNNRVENLEWVTRAENTHHAIRSGLMHPRNTPKRFGKDNPTSKAVLQYDTDGNFIKKWDSQSDAARHYSAKSSTISNCIDKPSKLFNGFMWVSCNGEIQQKISPSKSRFRPIKVIQFTMDKTPIKEWDNATVAARELNLTSKGIKDCCRGRQKTHGGFIWEFAS